jgi:hypothetical protein
MIKTDSSAEPYVNAEIELVSGSPAVVRYEVSDESGESLFVAVRLPRAVSKIESDHFAPVPIVQHEDSTFAFVHLEPERTSVIFKIALAGQASWQSDLISVSETALGRVLRVSLPFGERDLLYGSDLCQHLQNCVVANYSEVSVQFEPGFFVHVSGNEIAVNSPTFFPAERIDDSSFQIVFSASKISGSELVAATMFGALPFVFSLMLYLFGLPELARTSWVPIVFLLLYLAFLAGRWFLFWRSEPQRNGDLPVLFSVICVFGALIAIWRLVTMKKSGANPT